MMAHARARRVSGGVKVVPRHHESSGRPVGVVAGAVVAASRGPRPDLAVFCEARRARYEEYARLRTGDRALGVETVGAVFAGLAGQWPQVLRGPNPASDAWRLLGVAIQAVGGVPVPGSTEETLYEVLPTREADAVALHYLLGMTLTSAAELTGDEASTVAARVLAAERALPARVVRALESRSPLRG